MKKIVIGFVLGALICFQGFAQNDVDALRYSMTTLGGTARFMSMAGTFGSLGADFSTSTTNPAGLGLYKRSEFTITPAVFIGRTESEYLGTSSYDSRSNFYLGNAGFVYASPPKKNSESILKNFQISFGVNRSNDFNNRVLIRGFNNQNSIVDTYVDRAWGIPYSEFENEGNQFYAFDLTPAWYTYMIDTIPGTNDQYFGVVPIGTGIGQRKEINSWGSMNDLLFALSANFNDRMYLGASFNFPFIRFYQESVYIEEDIENNLDDFDRLTIYDNLATRGSGFNFKVGTIIRVTNFFRIGGAFHSPTWFFSMRDEWYSEYSTRFDDGDSFFERTPFGSYDYKLETPWRALGSASFILGRAVLLSAEYEYTDYSQSRLSSGMYNYSDENDAIRSKYTEAHTLRVGTEIRMGYFTIRGGAGYYTSPFADDINDGERMFFSAGIGFRDRNFFADLGYVQSFSPVDYYMYGSENIDADPVRNDITTYNILLTLGFRY
jgi:hypothetical protein